MLLNLLISEFENLKAILIRSLRSLSLWKVIYDPPIRECLLNIFISKENNQVAVRVSLSSHSIREDDFFLAWLVNPLDLSVMANDLLNDLLVLTSLLVVLVTEFEWVVLILVIWRFILSWLLLTFIHVLSVVLRLILILLWLLFYLMLRSLRHVFWSLRERIAISFLLLQHFLWLTVRCDVALFILLLTVRLR